MRHQQLCRALVAGFAKNETPSEQPTAGGNWEVSIGGITTVTVPWNETLGYWLLQDASGSVWIKHDGCWTLYESVGSVTLTIPSSETRRSAKMFVCNHEGTEATCTWHE